MLAIKENSHPGFRVSTVEPRPDFSFAISNTPTGLGDPLYDFRGGPRSSGYFRDAETQLDYAVNRYHQPGMGRFLTVDPQMDGAKRNDPGSWNRYAYTRGDPVNRVDRRGRDDCDPDYPEYCDDDGDLTCDDGTLHFLPEPLPACAGADPNRNGEGEEVACPANTQPDGSGNCIPFCPLVSLIGVNYTIAPGSNAVALFNIYFAMALENAFETLNQEGIVPQILSGFRTPAVQAAQANSPYFSTYVSWHEVGEAIDINTSGPNGNAIVAALTSAGLVWGGTWQKSDPIHFQGDPSGTSKMSRS
jgi:RHS repeat-associated protein